MRSFQYRRLLSVVAGLWFASLAANPVRAANDQRFPGANGQPFRALQSEIVSLQSQIDTLQAQVTQLDARVGQAESKIAELEAQIAAANAQIATLQADSSTNSTQIAALQAQTSTNSAQILALQNNVNSLSSQQLILTSQVNILTAFKNGLVANPCAAGSSIRQVNTDGTTVCEIDTADGVQIFFETTMLSNNTGMPVDITCPGGMRFINGGYSHQAGVSISAALPLGNGYSVSAFNSSGGTRAVTVLATCSAI